MKYYVGLCSEGNRWQTFSADSAEDATPEATGYIAVTYALDTSQDATDLAKQLNQEY